MAVYERNYGRYTGELTPTWSRFLVLPRYAREEVFRSRLFVAFFALCFALPFAGLIMIYLHHNLAALKFIGLPLDKLKEALPINATFFWYGLRSQGILAFLLAFFVGPALVAPDLRNNGLPLYLSRPFTRSEYVLGKLTLLAGLLSAITWVPGLLLFAFQSYLDGWKWFSDHLYVAWALFAGSWIWILTLSLLALAISAWVKWKPVARIAMAILFFVTQGFALALDEKLDTWGGKLISIWDSACALWTGLFGTAPPLGDIEQGRVMPSWAAWTTLVACCLLSLFLLSRRIRAYEVVR
jgi:ABC-2 type transport system permease protein